MERESPISELYLYAYFLPLIGLMGALYFHQLLLAGLGFLAASSFPIFLLGKFEPAKFEREMLGKFLLVALAYAFPFAVFLLVVAFCPLDSLERAAWEGYWFLGILILPYAREGLKFSLVNSFEERKYAVYLAFAVGWLLITGLRYGLGLKSVFPVAFLEAFQFLYYELVSSKVLDVGRVDALIFGHWVASSAVLLCTL